MGIFAQIITYIAIIFFLVLIALLFKKGNTRLLFCCILISAVLILSSQKWFQGFLETGFIHIIRQYGKKLSDFNETLISIQSQLETQQKNIIESQNSISIVQNKIIEQQEKLENIESIVKNTFERIKNEVFSYLNKDRMIIAEHSKQHATIILILSETPIPQTIRLQYHIFSQPTDAYNISNNLLKINWGGTVEGLFSEKLFYVTYVPDPIKRDMKSIVTTKDGIIYIDNQPIIFEKGWQYTVR